MFVAQMQETIQSGQSTWITTMLWYRSQYEKIPADNAPKLAKSIIVLFLSSLILKTNPNINVIEYPMIPSKELGNPSIDACLEFITVRQFIAEFTVQGRESEEAFKKFISSIDNINDTYKPNNENNIMINGIMKDDFRYFFI